MTRETAALLRDSLALDESERAEMAAALLESLEPEADEHEIGLAWRDEVRRRLAELDRGETQLVEWSTVRDEMLARLNARRSAGGSLRGEGGDPRSVRLVPAP